MLKRITKPSCGCSSGKDPFGGFIARIPLLCGKGLLFQKLPICSVRLQSL